MIVISVQDIERAISQGQKLVKAAKAKVGNGKKRKSTEKLKKYSR